MAELVWTFRQITGNHKKEVLTLAGGFAPHGRPRQRAVVRDGLTIRQRTTRYPGNSGPPTRHVMGITHSDFDLNGRFRDRDLGPGGALRKKDEVTFFVADQELCDISWGDLIHVTGMITEFDPGIEGPGEIEWKMKILVDQDNRHLAPPGNLTTIHRSIPDFGAKLASTAELLSTGLTSPDAVGFQSNLFDYIDDYVSVVTGTVGQLVQYSALIGDLEQGFSDEANRLIAGCHQAKSAILNLTNALTSLDQEALFVRDSAEDEIRFKAMACNFYTNADISLALLSDIENTATASVKSNKTLTYKVSDGDTFESISTNIYGGPGNANDIRRANKIKFGTKPKAGQTLIIPTI